ncbi:serine-glyoxylate aminotransferase-like protein [Medicago truncatula]|uniref:alanine--glyoxylate transaminase n=1 Tax=Medicago truncatula TaxID=3880 RepID=G7K619_MEDTR|nr:serine-glyoxylate aminotransferase-like protein [Medicago truncatula]
MDFAYGPGRNHLFVPGNNENHRTPAITALTKTLLDDVKKIFKTTSRIPFLIPTTVYFLIGQFSLLWIEQQKCLNFKIDVVESEWGQGVDLDALESKLASDKTHTIKAICIVHNETTTCNIIDFKYKYQHPSLIIVDAVSSIGALDFRMDEWGVDVVVTSSQKALSLSTGMGIVCAGPKAIEASKSATSLRSFFDWNGYLKCYNLGTYWPYTPSIQLLYGLRAALDLVFEEGFENVILRHKLVVEWYSASVTAIVGPPNIDSGEIVSRAWKRCNLSLGGGLNKVAGKVFRIGHVGHLNELQLLGCLAGVEMTLKDVGYPVQLGSGVAAASAYLLNNVPIIPSRI